jgi:hypothetical protein
MLCAYCYVRILEGSEPEKCAGCRKRTYCSAKCKGADWQECHERWCGGSGERGFDFDVREATGKGLGVYASRPFHRNEVVMVDRVVGLALVDYTGPISTQTQQVGNQSKPQVPENDARLKIRNHCAFSQLTCLAPSF